MDRTATSLVVKAPICELVSPETALVDSAAAPEVVSAAILAEDNPTICAPVKAPAWDVVNDATSAVVSPAS